MNDIKDIRKALFLLGGHDLEMKVIRETLERDGIAFADHGLDWDGARLSSYREEIAEAERNGQDIYGIELREDISLPEAYHRIDHHNRLSANPSSIEQVYELLGLAMDKRAKMVAANDKGYIPAMLEAGATEEEAMSIRREDRNAQGVTEDDERQAEEAIKKQETIGNLIIVRTESPRFSAVTDKLWPYRRLLVYTDTELEYSGEHASWVYNVLKGRNKEAAYCGGGDNGYAGIALPDRQDTIKSVTKEIITLMSTYSYHIFYLPFAWKRYESNEKTLSEQIKLKGIEPKPGSCWERISEEPQDEKEKEELFNERQFFFPFVHPIMYDNGKDESLILHFEHSKPKSVNVEYKIEVTEKETYTLKVESMNLNLYSTGVGVLSLFLANNETKEEADILNINQFGRRIMLPFYGDKEGRGQTAKSLSITFNDGNDAGYTENFEGVEPSKKDTWKPASFIIKLIEDLSDDIDTEEIRPLIDDRMLVNCWYPNNYLACGVKNDKDFMISDFWYRYVFVDKADEVTCQNDEMKKELLEESTYKRWQKYGSLYGLTRYSMVALTDEEWFASNILAIHFRTLYSRMFELVMVQRASILRFSDEVTKVSKLKSESDDESRHLAKCIESLYREYISFANQVYFPYVTAQDQGIEMYNILMKQFKSNKMVKDLDEEIDELYQFITLRNEREQNEIEWKQSESGRWLNIIAFIFLPITVVAAILGMSEFHPDMLLGIAICLIFTVLVIYIYSRYHEQLANWWDKISNKKHESNKK